LRSIQRNSRSRTLRTILTLSVLLFLVAPTIGRADAPPREEGWLNQNYFDAPKTQFLSEILTNAERNHFSQGNFWSQYKAGEYEYALGNLKYVLGVFPNHPRALHMMTLICKTLKDYDTPVMFFEKAVRMFPEVAYTQAQYAGYLLSVGQPQNALSHAQEALRIDPSFTYAQALYEEASEKVKEQNNPKPAAGGGTSPSSSAQGTSSAATKTASQAH